MIVLSLIVFLIAAWGYRQSSAQVPAASSELKIAVVDVAKVLSECQANLDRQNQSQEKEKKINADLEVIKNESDALKNELENILKPGSKEYDEKLQQWFDKLALLESRKKAQNKIFTFETQAWMETLYERFLKEVASIARQEGISLVIEKDDSPISTEKISDLYTMIRMRKVLYNAPTLDLTAKVLENMDRAYEAEKTVVK